jgi:thiosulfate reductase cytochrome b subunit
VNDLISHVERIQKHSLRLNQSVQAAVDLHFSAIANQTNENMRILAIITAIFAPLTLLTGLYGMNFEFIPGLQSPTGFWLMLLVMLVTTLALIFYFYQRHLLGRGEKSVLELLAQQPDQRYANFWGLLDESRVKKPLKRLTRQTTKSTHELD